MEKFYEDANRVNERKSLFGDKKNNFNNVRFGEEKFRVNLYLFRRIELNGGESWTIGKLEKRSFQLLLHEFIEGCLKKYLGSRMNGRSYLEFKRNAREVYFPHRRNSISNNRR